MTSKLRLISWIVLALVGALMLLGASASTQLALSRGGDQFGSLGMSELTQGDEDLAGLLYARRNTAAAYAAGYALLFLIVVLIPYRRGEAWSWWAILAAALGSSALILLRIPFLGVTLGTGTAWLQGGVVLAALLLDAGRLRSSPQR
ncbi:MAG: hypothetical protein FJW35_01540 [Acidobacteria bacterium]|nr:hypothetical protein [Acidobacteriota bacterium]